MEHSLRPGGKRHFQQQIPGVFQFQKIQVLRPGNSIEIIHLGAQEKLLKEDGIEVKDGRVDLKKYGI